MGIGDGTRPQRSGGAPAPSSSLRTTARWSAFALPLAAFWLAVLLVGAFDFGYGVQRSLVYVAVLAGLLLLNRGTRQISAPHRSFRAAALVASLLLGAWHLGVLVAESPKRVEIDVASTTIAAGDLMFQGRNPYRIPIDYRPEITERVNVHAYKYGPVMAAAYRPFVVLFGENGVRLANLALDALTALLVFALASRLGGASAALITLPLYLSLSTVPALLYIEPFNDLVAVLPLALGLLLFGGRPFAVGLLAGLSTSAKLLPGVIFLPFLLPESARSRLWFLAGLAGGLLPLLAYAAMSPPDFVGNIVTFNLLRPADSTSWMLGLPDWVPRLSKAAAGLIVLAAVVVAVLRPGGLSWRDRVLLAVTCTILVSLVGFGVRRNYVLWWLPFATALVAAHAANRLPQRVTGPPETPSG